MQSAQKVSLSDQNIRQELERIILDNDVPVRLQPIVSLEKNEVVGYEAIARGPIGSPLEDAHYLLSAASKYGLNDELEYAALVSALNFQHELPAGHFLSINVGASLFLSKLFSEVTNLCQHIAHQIVFELTENVPFTELASIEGQIKALSGMGYRISLNNTDRGFSGIERARKLNPSIIKLRLSTVVSMTSHKAEQERLSSILNKLKADQIRLQVDDINQPEHRSQLATLGITLGQGYLFGKPSSLTDVLNAGTR